MHVSALSYAESGPRHRINVKRPTIDPHGQYTCAPVSCRASGRTHGGWGVRDATTAENSVPDGARYATRLGDYAGQTQCAVQMPNKNRAINKTRQKTATRQHVMSTRSQRAFAGIGSAGATRIRLEADARRLSFFRVSRTRYVAQFDVRDPCGTDARARAWPDQELALAGRGSSTADWGSVRPVKCTRPRWRVRGSNGIW